MRKAFYALILKMLDFFYDNTIDKVAMTSLVTSIMRVYVSDSQVTLLQFFSDFSFLIQSQYNDPSWYQS